MGAGNTSDRRSRRCEMRPVQAMARSSTRSILEVGSGMDLLDMDDIPWSVMMWHSWQLAIDGVVPLGGFFGSEFYRTSHVG